MYHVSSISLVQGANCSSSGFNCEAVTEPRLHDGKVRSWESIGHTKARANSWNKPSTRALSREGYQLQHRISELVAIELGGEKTNYDEKDEFKDGEVQGCSQNYGQSKCQLSSPRGREDESHDSDRRCIEPSGFGACLFPPRVYCPVSPSCLDPQPCDSPMLQQPPSCKSKHFEGLYNPCDRLVQF